MIGHVIIALIVLIFSSSAALVIANVASVYSSVSVASKNFLVLERVSKVYNRLLRESVDDGLVYAVQPDVSLSYSALPSSMSSHKSTAWGQPLLYCPVAGDANILAGDTTVSVASPNGYEYDVVIENGVVVKSDLLPVGHDLDILGFVLSPIKQGVNSFGCNTIENTNGRYSSVGAVVQPLYRSYSEEDGFEFRSNVAGLYVSVNGVGDGYTANNPTSLESAISYWRQKSPSDFFIKINGGAYTLHEAYFTSQDIGNGAKAPSLRLLWNGEGLEPSIDAVDDAGDSVPASLEWFGVVSFEGVSFPSNVAFKVRNSQYYFNNSSIGSLDVSVGSDIEVVSSYVKSISASTSNLVLNQVAFNSSSALPFIASESSKIKVYGNLTFTGSNKVEFITLKKSTVMTIPNVSEVNFTGVSGLANSAVSIDESSSFEVDQANFIGGGVAKVLIDNYGNLALTNSTLAAGSNTEAVIKVRSGSQSYVADSSIGGSSGEPLVGVVADEGIIFIKGSGLQIDAKTCASGFPFYASTSNVTSPDTSYSATTHSAINEYEFYQIKIINKSNWACI